MSKTPRTDEQSFFVYPYQIHGQIVGNKAVAIDFARQLETELAEAQAEIERLNRQLDEFYEHLYYGWHIESREELEKIAAETWNPPNALCVALHYIWKREVKDPAKDELIEQRWEALKLALPEARSTYCENTMRAAIEAAERGDK